MKKIERATWFAEEQVLASVRLDVALVLLALAIAAWVSYKLLLRKASFDRHLIFLEHFKNLAAHSIVGAILFGAFHLVSIAPGDLAKASLPYIGLLVIGSACTITVKILRIVAYQFLFFTSMRAGVPLLLVNVFTLIISTIMVGWYLTKFFYIDLTPLLATSAILSIVLGLALQDTLGNLFAAIALQIDKPFELGDWVELRNGSDRIAGQVYEVSWRATVLQAMTEELVTIPNRNMAQWQIFNFGGHHRSFIRSHVFRLPYGAQIDMAKVVLLSSASAVPGILRNPPPTVVIRDITESWIVLRISYSIADYASQYGIADKFMTRALADLAEAGIELAGPRIVVEQPKSRENSQAA